MDVELLLLLLTGFVAQLVDGALGMAFGVISTSVVMSLGMPAAQASDSGLNSNVQMAVSMARSAETRAR